MIYLAALSRVLPVVFLFLLGAGLRARRFVRAETIQDLKKLVINVTLPAVLFLAFSSVALEPRHLVIVAIVFGLCGVALLLGYGLLRVRGTPLPYFPMLMTGFEAGMMGYAIYGAVFGQQNIFKFALIDLGQVVFVFFVLATVLRRMVSGAGSFGATVGGFLKTPVIIAILLGILANQSGAIRVMASWPVSAAILSTLELLGAVTTPLIAVIIGFEMRLEPGILGRPLGAIGLRLLFWVPIGLLFSVVVVRGLLGMDRLVEAAVMTMFVLPPPFVIPLYIPECDRENMTFVVNTLSLATMVTLVAFTLVSVAYGR